MNRLRHNKILTKALYIIAASAFMWLVSPAVTYAATGLKAAAEHIGGIVASGAIVYFVLFVGMAVLSQTLAIVGTFLDFAFMMNAYVNPGQLYIVQQGWIILRDLANGIFILLLLWIAITIIFNLEGQWGGRRFLARIIMVALLINFSLALVSTVFAFGNELAKPFAKAMGAQICSEYTDSTGKKMMTCPPPKQTLSKLIISNSQIQEVTKIFTEKGALETFTEAAKAFKNPQPVPDTTETFGYLGAPQTAHAAVPWKGIGRTCAGLAALGGVASATFVGASVGVPAAVVGGICALVIEVALPLGLAYFASFTDIPQAVIKSIFDMVVANAFLLITVLAMLTAAVILLLRLVAMVFLGVLAPAAFLGIAFPKYGDRIWSPWIENLFRWTFVAPIFYFLLYLAFLMLESNNSLSGGNSGGPAAAVPFAGNLFKILNLILFLVFLWAAVYMTKKTAGHTAEVALGLGRKAAGFGLGVATGFAARGLGKAALRGQPYIEKTFGALGRVSPIGRMLGRRTNAYIQRQRKQVEDREAQFAGGSEDFLKSQLASARSAEDIAAIARVAVKEGKTGAIAGQEERIVRAASRLGVQEPLMKVAPHLATVKNVSGLPAGATNAQAIDRVISRMNTEEKTKIGKQSFSGADTTKNNEVLDALWQHSRNTDLEQIGLKNKDMQEAMFNRLNNMSATELTRFRGNLTSTQDTNLNQYFTGALANGTGTPWRPRNWNASIRPGSSPPTPPTPGPAPTITSVYPGRGRAANPYTFTPRATGGSGTYTNWRIAAGSSLPHGLTINSTTGIIDGTPTTAGTYVFSLEVTDDTGAVSPPQTFNVTINP